MGNRFSGLIATAAITAVAGAAIAVSVTPTSAQAPAVSGAVLKTPPLKTAWGEPDLQGIWTDEFETPLQRPAKYANQEFFTEAQRAELDRVRSGILGRRAAERDANNGYNGAVFFSTKRTGARTSKIADPPNGRLPPLTPEAQKAAATDREFRLALVQSTDTCKKGLAGCAGWKYDPATSPRRAETPPRYITRAINRNDGPEDSSLAERCLTGGLPVKVSNTEMNTLDIQGDAFHPEWNDSISVRPKFAKRKADLRYGGPRSRVGQGGHPIKQRWPDGISVNNGKADSTSRMV